MVIGGVQTRSKRLGPPARGDVPDLWVCALAVRGKKVGEPELLGDGFPVPVEVPASPGLLATDHFELGSGIDVSTDAPGFVTPHEVQDLVGGHEGSTSIPLDGTACGVPLKSDRAIIPPYSSVVVVNWLLGGAGVDMEDTVFSIDGREARWDDLLTLVPGSEIGTAVIDAWACLLNRREISRNSAAPTRFFASTFTTLHTIVDTSHSREQRVKWFRERLLLDFKSCPHSDITKVDMIFFPILRREHYFLLCFDFRRYCLEIIDNASAPTTNKEKYGESLEDMQDMLSEFYNKVHNGRSILCAGLVPKRMQMAWCDSRNKIDCGVYLMRHMESFLGQGVLDWDCGLVKEEYSTLHKLRLQYMKELVVSEYNLHRGRNLSRAYQSIGGPIAS
nr:uncharacterized protein LOC109168900 [Ipomoea trifida]